MNMNMFDDASLPQIDAVISALGMGLLHSLWQCALIGALAWLTLRTLRHASPQARYVVACAALAACVLWPAAEVLRQLSTATAPTFDMSATVSSQRDMASMFAAFAAPDRPADLRSILEAALPWLVAIWAAGACLMLLRLAGGLRWVHRLQGDALDVENDLENQAWQTRRDRLAQRFGLSACRACGLQCSTIPAARCPPASCDRWCWCRRRCGRACLRTGWKRCSPTNSRTSAMGAKMEALGAEQEREMARIDRQIRAESDRAMSAGLATPAPSRK